MRSFCLVVLILTFVTINTVQSASLAKNVLHLMLKLPTSDGYTNLTVPLPEESGVCLKGSSGRGVGTLPEVVCNDDEELYGALCYPKCQDGYEAVGCCLCRQKECPIEFTDDGVATCIKPESYSRGAGYPRKFGDDLDKSNMFKRCESEHGIGNCEESGAIVYPKCRSDFHAVGCCICSPDCPNDMSDIGVSCEKKTYGRGVGVSRLTCSDNKEKDALLCYDKCSSGWYGVGPVCWQHCPSSKSFDCGVMCTVDELTCADETLAIVKSAIEVGGNLFIGISTSDVVSIIQAALQTATTVADVMSNGYC